MRFKKINFLQVGISGLLLIHSNCEAYDEFYYRDKEALESRFVECLKKWPGVLVNYPVSSNSKEAATEANLVSRYGEDATLESVLSDSKRAISKSDYYGLVMISASIPSDKVGNEIKKSFIDFTRTKLGDNKYQNAILAFCVKTVVSKSFLMDGDLVNRDRMGSIFGFVTDLRLNGFDHKNYDGLVGIDNKIIEDCFLEIMR